jgi:hypothetical protein
MRRTLLLVLLGLLIGAGVLIWWPAGGGEEPVVGGPGAESPGTQPGERGGRGEVTDNRAAETRGTGETGERIEVPPASRLVTGGPQELRLVVLDAETKAALAGAAVVDGTNGRRLATSDGTGLVVVQGIDLTHLLFLAEGYLIGFWPEGTTRLAAMREQLGKLGRAEAVLQPDRYTLPVMLRFLGGDGQLAARVMWRLTPLDDPPPSSGSFPRARYGDGPVPAELMEAWRSHAWAAALPAARGRMHHFGIDSALTIFETQGEAVVNCIAEGAYLMAARAGDQIARETVHLIPGEQVITVQLGPGRACEGSVHSSDGGKPVVGAHVFLSEPALGVEAARTDAQGRFRIAPLSPTPIMLRVQHPDHTDASVGPLRPGGPALRIDLAARPRLAVSGVVVSRGANTPLAGATVILRQGGAVLATGKTGADGSFSLPTAAEEPDLLVRMPGHVEWSEVVTPGGSALSIALLPDDPELRVRQGISGIVRGRVFGADGQPRAGEIVQLVPEDLRPPEGIAGRRILFGAVLPLVPHVQTVAGGEFAFESMASGRARLVLVDRAGAVELPVTLVPGQEQKGLDLRARR